MNLLGWGLYCCFHLWANIHLVHNFLDSDRTNALDSLENRSVVLLLKPSLSERVRNTDRNSFSIQRRDKSILKPSREIGLTQREFELSEYCLPEFMGIHRMTADS